jgi:thiol:disulfide interchange protein DsbA
MKLAKAWMILALLVSGIVTGHAAPNWQEGKNYFVIVPAQAPGVGKIQVTEVFSYGCPACNQFQPVIEKLRKSLPANAEMTFLPASFNAAEDWPLFQRAYLAAQVLGVADKTHQAMFDAVWKTGELATLDPATGRLKDHLPTLDDVAKFYNVHAGVSPAQFVATAKSFSVESKVRNADQLVTAYGIDRTPSIVVNGKYLCQVESAGGADQLIALVDWLVAKEAKQ